MKSYNQDHGSPYDRGSADRYYGRAFAPHWYPQGTYVGSRITDLSDDEIEAYTAGYNEQVDQKEWC